MKCNEICDLLSLYIDNELNDEEMHQVEEHLQSCENCQKELDEYKNIISILQSLPEEEPPEGYCKRLHNKLLETGRQTKPKKEAFNIKNINRFKWMKYGSLAAALVLVLLVAGINNLGRMNMKAKTEASYDRADSPAEYKGASVAPQAPQAAPRPPLVEEPAGEDYQVAYDEALYGGMGKPETEILMTSALRAQQELKIIKTGTLSAQTEDYEKFLNDLSMKISGLGGFLESNNTEVYQVYNDRKLMYGSIRIRVPQESFYEVVEYLENTLEVKRKNVAETDVTKEYYEKDNKVKNLEVQEEHLRDLFEKATSVEEMLLIENELRRVRTEIDALNISLSEINDRAAMSTINLEVEEVMPASLTLKTKDSVWDRSKNGFINTVNSIIRALENLVVNLVSSSPILLPFIVICLVGFFKIRKYWKGKI